MRKKLLLLAPVLAVAVMLGLTSVSAPSTAQAAPPDKCGENATTVPGHCDKDSGTVVGHYYSVYAYDATGDYYWDLGDGREQGTVDSIDELDAETLTTCNYIVNYRGDFGADPFLDMGSIQNIIRCEGYDDNAVYMFIAVSPEDPRYTGEGTAIFGTWEIHVDVISGTGNIES